MNHFAVLLNIRRRQKGNDTVPESRNTLCSPPHQPPKKRRHNPCRALLAVTHRPTSKFPTQKREAPPFPHPHRTQASPAPSTALFETRAPNKACSDAAATNYRKPPTHYDQSAQWLRRRHPRFRCSRGCSGSPRPCSVRAQLQLTMQHSQPFRGRMANLFVHYSCLVLRVRRFLPNSSATVALLRRMRHTSWRAASRRKPPRELRLTFPCPDMHCSSSASPGTRFRGCA